MKKRTWFEKLTDTKVLEFIKREINLELLQAKANFLVPKIFKFLKYTKIYNFAFGCLTI
jgi:hypothetical protein